MTYDCVRRERKEKFAMHGHAILKYFTIEMLLATIMLSATIVPPVSASYTARLRSWVGYNKKTGEYWYKYTLTNVDAGGDGGIWRLRIWKDSASSIHKVSKPVFWEFEESSDGTYFEFAVIPGFEDTSAIAEGLSGYFSVYSYDGYGDFDFEAEWNDLTTARDGAFAPLSGSSNYTSKFGDSFGGTYIPVDKFALLAPYITLVSTILVATVATAIYVKHVKRRKEKK